MLSHQLLGAGLREKKSEVKGWQEGNGGEVKPASIREKEKASRRLETRERRGATEAGKRKMEGECTSRKA